MNVVHVVPALFGPEGIVGGAERYACELARHMADRVDTTLVACGDRDRAERVGSLDVRVIGGAWYVRGQRHNPFHPRVLAALGDADVVHCHQQHIVMSSAVALWCRARRKRVFVSELGGGGWDISAYLSTDAWFHGHLHLSDYSRRICGHDGMRTAQVIGAGVDIETFSPDRLVTRTGAALFVGRLLPHKGIDDLIRGLPPGVALTIVGPRPDPATAAGLVQLAAGKPVVFKEGLDDRALVAEYRRALCVVLPSVYRMPGGDETRVPELFGQTLIEGMACETPAICTNVASLPEVVADGVTGFVVSPHDPGALGARLLQLQRDPGVADAMGRAARARVLERFTWPLVVERCLAAYAGTSST